MLAMPRATEWIRDLTEEGIESHPGPTICSKNIDGLTNRFEDTMKLIATRHAHSPILAVMLQEHHLTAQKAQDLKVETVARNHGLMYVQAHRPIIGSDKGGTAIIMPSTRLSAPPQNPRVKPETA